MKITESGIAVPNHVFTPKLPKEKPLDATSAEEREAQLPVPTGYRILLALPEQAEAYDSGILKSDQTRAGDEVATVVAYVVAMGPDCFKNKELFPSGSYCGVGDWVLIRPYSGTRFKVHGHEMRIVSDGNIEAVVADPRGITRIGG